MLIAESAAVLVASIAAGIVSIIGAIFAGLAALRAKVIQVEVQTMNELTLGQLGARDETRRIDEIPEDDRTAQERRHLEAQ